MKTQEINARGYSAVARIPSREDVENLKVGDMAPDCFGKMAMVTRISYRGVDINGKAFVGYYAAMSPEDIDTGCGCSNSMKEGELIRTVALTGALNSADCDTLEYQMNQN